MIRKQKTELHYNLFHPKNTLKTIFENAKASFILSHGEDINMKAICRIISESEKVYRALPLNERKILKFDMINLRKYKDIDYLRKGLMLNKMMKKFKSDDSFISYDKKAKIIDYDESEISQLNDTIRMDDKK